MLEHAQFVTEPERCPYLPDRDWQLEVRYVSFVSPAEHGLELARGVRRFGHSYFRPVCDSCQACVPLRVPVKSFKPSRSQRRVLRRNSDISVEIGEPAIDDERLDLYHRFHLDRHLRLDWPAPRVDPDEYRQSFLENPVLTHEFRFRLADRLIAIAYVDESSDALSSQYGFHAPELAKRSLGTFDVLTEIKAARELQKEHVYLGFYVNGCRSMEYKTAFRPYELYREGRWCPGDGSCA